MPTQTNTQNTAHTPGPWWVEDVGIPTGTLAIVAGGPREYHWLATASEDFESGIDWTQTQANARLIAQAPRMAELLMRWATQGVLPDLAQETRHVLREAGTLP